MLQITDPLDKAGDRTVSDMLMPAQVVSRHAMTPERVLISTVLLDAIECFQKNCGAATPFRRRLFQEACEWIFGGDASAPLSFEDVCHGLSLDAECIRGGLRQWYERQLACRAADECRSGA